MLLKSTSVSTYLSRTGHIKISVDISYRHLRITDIRFDSSRQNHKWSIHHQNPYCNVSSKNRFYIRIRAEFKHHLFTAHKDVKAVRLRWTTSFKIIRKSHTFVLIVFSESYAAIYTNKTLAAENKTMKISLHSHSVIVIVCKKEWDLSSSHWIFWMIISFHDGVNVMIRARIYMFFKMLKYDKNCKISFNYVST